MNEQPEALRLAAHAEANSNFGDMKSIAAELRRLHEVNQELLAALKAYQKAGCGNSTDFALQSDAGILARAAIAKGEQK